MSYTLAIKEPAKNFHLLATDGNYYSLKDFETAKGLVVFFTCNHCPYVIGSNPDTQKLAQRYQKDNIQFIAINSNSPNTYAEDSYEHMVELMQEKHYPWVYLYDATQEVAKSYGALKTPHFFLFDEERKLIYTGRAINHPRDYTQASTHELDDAIAAFLKGSPIQIPVTNPIGCNIKWEGKPKHWMPPEACDLI